MFSRNIMNIFNHIVCIVFLLIFYKMTGFAGAGLLISSLLIFYVLFTLLMGSIKSTVARMVAARRHRGFNDNAKKIYKKLLIYTIIVSIIMALFFKFAPFVLSKLFLGNKIAGDILVYCSLLFAFYAIAQCLTGNFLGCENINIIAISEIVGAIVMLSTCPIIVSKMTQYGTNVSLLLKNDLMVELYGCEGAIISLCISTFVMLIILITGTRGSFKVEDYLYNELRGKDSFRGFLKSFLPVAFNIFKENMFPLFTIFFAVVLFSRNLLHHGSSVRDNFNMLGTFFMLACIIISFVLIIFKDYITKQKKFLHQDFKQEEYKSLIFRFNYLLANTLFIILPIMLSILVFSNDLATNIFKVEDESLTGIIRIAGVLVLFIGVDLFFKITLESINGSKVAFLGDIAGFLATMFYLIAIGKNELTITKILIALVLNYSILLIIHGYFSIKYVGLRLNDLLAKIIKISISAAVMLVVEIIFNKLFNMNLLILLIAIVISYVFYFAVIVAIKTYSHKDVNTLEGTISYYPVNLGLNIFSGK